MMGTCWLSAMHALSVVRSSRQGLCACCFTLARWRVSFATIFHAHHHHQRAGAVDLAAELAYVVEPQVALDLFGLCVVQTAHAIGLDLTAPGSQNWTGQTDQEEARYRCVWPPPYWRVLLRDDETSSRCAGYDAACVDDLLRRLAKISLLGDYPCVGNWCWRYAACCVGSGDGRLQDEAAARCCACADLCGQLQRLRRLAAKLAQADASLVALHHLCSVKRFDDRVVAIRMPRQLGDRDQQGSHGADGLDQALSHEGCAPGRATLPVARAQSLQSRT